MSKSRKRAGSNDGPSTSATAEGERSFTASSGAAAQDADRRGDPMLADERQHRIAVAAYYRAECRGFKPGCEMDDWLEAEAEIGQRADRRAV